MWLELLLPSSVSSNHRFPTFLRNSSTHRIFAASSILSTLHLLPIPSTPQRAGGTMRISSLAIVALATQSLASSWLGGKAGTYEPFTTSNQMWWSPRTQSAQVVARDVPNRHTAFRHTDTATSIYVELDPSLTNTSSYSIQQMARD